MIARWATESDQEMDIPKMAAQLARLSDAYKDRSTDGILVPGNEEIDLKTQQKDEASLVASVMGAAITRRERGQDFKNNYAEHLQNV